MSRAVAPPRRRRLGDPRRAAGRNRDHVGAPPEDAVDAAIIGRDELAKVSLNLVLADAARGGIVDEQALSNALKEERLRRPGSTSLAQAPHVDSRCSSWRTWWRCPTSVFTDEAQEKAGVAVARSVRLALDGEPGLDAVNVQGVAASPRYARPVFPSPRSSATSSPRWPGRVGTTGRRRGPRPDHAGRRQGARARGPQGRALRHRRGVGLLRQRAAAGRRARVAEACCD